MRKITSIRLEDAIEHYVTDAKGRGKADSTVRCIRVILTGFLASLKYPPLVRNIDKQHVTRYFEGLEARAMAPSTVNLYTTWLRCFFDWCADEGYIETWVRPMRGRDLTKLAPAVRRRLDVDKFPALLDAARNPRDRMVLALGLYLLLRQSEIKAMRWGDLTFIDSRVQCYREKVKKTQWLPLCSELLVEIRNYKMWYSQHIGRAIEPGMYVVPANKWSHVNGPLGQTHNERGQWEKVNDRGMIQLLPLCQVNTPHLIVHYALEAVGFEPHLGVTTRQKGEGVHTLRRSGAWALFSNLADHGEDDALLLVMTMLGHAKPETTMIYLGFDKQEARLADKLAGRAMYPALSDPNVIPLPKRAEQG